MSVAAYQIIYVESGAARLYGELVQHMADRQTGWVRPISLLLTAAPEALLLDVRNGPDIIVAEHVIHPVLDTEWLEVLMTLSATKVACDYPEANQHLRTFLEQLLTPE
jgi:hypothetical protein